jgi:branched-chain amino acid transport system permease protein
MEKPTFEALLAGIPLGLLFTAGIVRYVQQSPVITLIVTLATALLIEQLVIVFFRYDVRLLPPFIEGSIDVHADPGALAMAILQAVILTLVLAFWAYRAFSAYARRGPTLRWVGIALLALVIEHGLTLLNAGKLAAEAAGNVASGLFAFGVAASIALGLFAYYYLKQNAASYAWLTAVGLCALLLVEQTAFLYYAWDAQSISFLFGNARGQDLKLIGNRLLLFAVAAAVIALFWYFVQRTRTGKAILATSMDQEGAALVGIDVRRVYTLTWALSGALAGVAGVFLAAWLPMLPVMWRDPLIISFAIVVLGGLGSLKGSLIAACLIGFAETITAYTPAIRVNLVPCDPFSFQPCYYFDLLGLSWVGVPSLIILVMILFLRPKGLFGREFE